MTYIYSLSPSRNSLLTIGNFYIPFRHGPITCPSPLPPAGWSLSVCLFPLSLSLSFSRSLALRLSRLSLALSLSRSLALSLSRSLALSLSCWRSCVVGHSTPKMECVIEPVEIQRSAATQRSNVETRASLLDDGVFHCSLVRVDLLHRALAI